MELNFLDTLECERIKGNFDYEKTLDVLATHEAEHLLFGGPQRPERKQEVRDYNEATDKRSTQLYNRVKTRLDGILNNPEVEDYIPKEYWDDFEKLTGCSFYLWGHPHMNFAHLKQIEALEKIGPADTLVVTPCTHTKPYSNTNRFKRFIRCSKETRKFDFLAFSVVPTLVAPYDASSRYPLANYSWPVGEASPVLDELKCIQSSKNFFELVNVLKYKKIIFIHWDSLNDRLKVLNERYNCWSFADSKNIENRKGFEYIEVHKLPVYRDSHRFKFSTKELPIPNKFYTGVLKTRFIEGTAVSCFMRDYFGPEVYPYFMQSWDNVSQGEKEYGNYSPELVENLMKELRGPLKSPDSGVWK